MNIYDAIESVIVDTGELDPNLVAEKVSADYPSKHLRVALRAVLPQAVLQLLSQHKCLSADAAGKIAVAAPVGNESLKGAQARKHRLDFVIHGPDGAMRLGDATVEVLLWIAERHDQTAAGHERSAVMHRELAKSLEVHKVLTVNELPADVVSRAWLR